MLIAKFDLSLEFFSWFPVVEQFYCILTFPSMTGEQVAAPSSPRDGEDITIPAGLPKVF